MFNRLSTHAHGPVTRPLVVRFGSMGDMVIALSLIEVVAASPAAVQQQVLAGGAVGARH